MPRKYTRNRRKNQAPSIPLHAFLLFLAITVLLKTGTAAAIESTVRESGRRFEAALVHTAAPQASAAAPALTDPEAPTAQSVFESALPEYIAERITQLPETNTVPVTIDGTSGSYDGSNAVYIKNETDFSIDIPALLKADDPVALSGNQVQVLVMHTHGTESYTPTLENNYTPSDTDRTTDCSYNVVRVGREITRILNEKGIKTVHSETLNDSPAYAGSYNRALEDITAYIKDNPSIKLVIDVHRDAMVAQNGTKYKTVATIDGRQTAQLMLVCGTDGGGLVHNGWRDNLSFQLKLQQRLNTAHPGLMRPLNLRAARFNQHVTYGSMLLEVGTTGNTLEEALSSARLFAEGLAELLLERG